jgi:hypothetical protein
MLIMRALTTLSEAQRIAKAGFSADDIMAGFRRVVDERASRRDELRADEETRVRRSRTLRIAFAMLAVSIVMSVIALSMRTKLPNGNHSSPWSAVVLIFSGTVLLGMSLVLLLRSPFRMPPGERLFRMVWLGPIGHAFVRFGTRRMKREGATVVAQPQVRAGSVPAPALALTRGPGSAPLPQPPDRLADLERRVTALEQSARVRSPQ